MLKLKLVILIIGAMLFNYPAYSRSDQDFTEDLKAKVRMIQHMALNPLIVKAVRYQNKGKVNNQVMKDSLEESSESEEFQFFKNANSDHISIMRRFVENNEGISEITLTDQQGKRVSVFPQSLGNNPIDKNQWSESYNNGNGQVYIGELLSEQSSNRFKTFVSAPILDREKTVGVLIVGLLLGS